MPFCFKCGEEVDDRDRFCTSCGNAQQHAARETMNQRNIHYSRNNRQGMNNFGPTLKLLIVVFAVFIFLFIYSNFFVTKPDNVVEDLFSSVNRLDFNSVISCLDPTIEQAYIAAGNITGGLFGVNLVDVMELMPIMPHMSDITGQEFQETNFQVTIKHVEINGQKVDGLFVNLLFVIDSFIDIYGDEAIVYADVHETETNIRGNLIFHLKKFSDYGWRIMDVHELNADQ